MTIATFPTSSATEQVDLLLDEIGETLQLTAKQYENAVTKYKAVGTWLGQDGSPIASLDPIIYPQGSMALQTTVRPFDGTEYDLDLVLQARRPVDNPMWLYEQTMLRLLAHGEYEKKVEPLNRCIRLNYANEFHLDIMPARFDLLRGGTCIEVPDKKLKHWKPCNPEGFRRWFEQQCAYGMIVTKFAQAPVPPNTPGYGKPVLKRATQLTKRRRDIAFAGRPDEAPRSIVLTTLFGHAYRGETSVAEALISILGTIELDIARAWPNRIVVANPTNPSERFCEKFTTSSYNAFVQFIRETHAEMRALVQLHGLDRITARLGDLFGSDVAGPATKKFVERMNQQRNSGLLKATGTGLTTGAGRTIPGHTFHGRKD